MIHGYVVWPYAVLVAAVVLARGAATGTPRDVVAARVTLVLYLGWLAGEVFFPLPVGAVAASLARSAAATQRGSVLSHVNVVPLSSIRELVGLGPTWPAIRILVGNILVFVPVGVLLPLAARVRASSWRAVLAAAVALSVAIEAGQLLASLALGFSYRVTELDDVLLNVAGVALGLGLLRLVRHRARAGRPATVAPPGRRC